MGVPGASISNRHPTATRHRDRRHYVIDDIMVVTVARLSHGQHAEYSLNRPIFCRTNVIVRPSRLILSILPNSYLRHHVSLGDVRPDSLTSARLLWRARCMRCYIPVLRPEPHGLSPPRNREFAGINVIQLDIKPAMSAWSARRSIAATPRTQWERKDD